MIALAKSTAPAVPKPKREQAGKTEILWLDPFRVKPFKDQPRKRFRGIPKLAESIRLVGQVTPIVVTSSGESEWDAELVDGERRLQACRLGKMRIKAVVEPDASPEDRFALAIAANFCRQEHDCMEIADAIHRLESHGRSRAEIAGIFGKTAGWVQQHCSLLKLHPEVQEMLKRAGDEKRESKKQRRRRGRMTISVALLLVPLEQPLQLKAAKTIASKQLSMAAARNHIRKLAGDVGQAVGKTVSPRQRFMALYKDFALMLAEVKSREASTLSGQIDQLCDDLLALGDSFTKAKGAAQ